jgi:hypothetical protein
MQVARYGTGNATNQVITITQTADRLVPLDSALLYYKLKVTINNVEKVSSSCLKYHSSAQEMQNALNALVQSSSYDFNSNGNAADDNDHITVSRNGDGSITSGYGYSFNLNFAGPQLYFGRSNILGNSAPQVQIINEGLYDIHIKTHTLAYLDEDESISHLPDLHDLKVNDIMSKNPIVLHQVLRVGDVFAGVVSGRDSEIACCQGHTMARVPLDVCVVVYGRVACGAGALGHSPCVPQAMRRSLCRQRFRDSGEGVLGQGMARWSGSDGRGHSVKSGQEVAGVFEDGLDSDLEHLPNQRVDSTDISVVFH